MNHQTAPDKPVLHFTPQYGWINDPNGLVYTDGWWHMYFQHNPQGIVWDHIGWGHAISRDLCSWRQLEDVLYPDADGMAFSGSGIVNTQGLLELPTDALLYFFTAAGGTTWQSRGKDFVQKTAYSTNGGHTLHILKELTLPALERKNRDPKVFWHEPSAAYIMCLWLRDDQFGILRSTDLRRWELTQRLRLPDGFECPDMFALPVDGGPETCWIFWTASGLWYAGTFDGYTFQRTGDTGYAYRTQLPYAAQTFANVPGRVISVPWLRCPNRERMYTGALGIPRELSLLRHNGTLLLCQSLAREVQRRFRIIGEGPNAEMPENGVLWIRTVLPVSRDAAWDIGGFTVRYAHREGVLYAGAERVALGPGIRQFSMLLDGTIFEITCDYDILYAPIDIPERPGGSGIQIDAGEDAVHQFWILS